MAAATAAAAGWEVAAEAATQEEEEEQSGRPLACAADPTEAVASARGRATAAAEHAAEATVAAAWEAERMAEAVAVVMMVVVGMAVGRPAAGSKAVVARVVVTAAAVRALALWVAAQTGVGLVEEAAMGLVLEAAGWWVAQMEAAAQVERRQRRRLPGIRRSRAVAQAVVDQRATKAAQPRDTVHYKRAAAAGLRLDVHAEQERACLVDLCAGLERTRPHTCRLRTGRIALQR
eukprot:1905938-Prymnesium_polylepis.1